MIPRRRHGLTLRVEPLDLRLAQRLDRALPELRMLVAAGSISRKPQPPVWLELIYVLGLLAVLPFAWLAVDRLFSCFR